MKLCIIRHVKLPVHQLQPPTAIQAFCPYSQSLEVIKDVCFNMNQSRLCRFHGLGMYPKCQILGLGKTIVSCLHLMKQHFRIFVPYIIKAILFMGNPDALLEIRYIRCHVLE